MRAFVITGPGEGGVVDVEPPEPGDGEVLIDVERVGLCGTDVELFTGEMAYLRTGLTGYPLRIGHEWCGVVANVGPGVAPRWIGRRVTGDTMLGCGHCERCLGGRHHLCRNLRELGIRGIAGALAEQVAVPAASLHELPDTVDATTGAMVEPGGNALRAFRALGLGPDENLPGLGEGGQRPGLGRSGRVLVVGPGTIGLLVAQFALAAGVEVHLVGLADRATAFARTLGFAGVWTVAELAEAGSRGELGEFAGVVDASTGADVPALAVDLVEPGGTVVCIGLSGTPSWIDTRQLVLKDVTAVGILGASQGLAGAIEQFATRAVDPRPLLAATVGLDQAAGVLAGRSVPGSGQGPKVQVDPRLRVGETGVSDGRL